LPALQQQLISPTVVNLLSFLASPVNCGNNLQYQWYVNNVLQASHAANFTLNPASNGISVYAKMTSSIACAYPQVVSSSLETIQCISPNTSNSDTVETITVSPNPSNGLFIVKLNLTEQKDVYFTVADASGNL
jgi:hypothetical protein